MKSDPTNLYLLDFGNAGSYIFKSTDDQAANRHAADINAVVRSMIKRDYPNYDFSLLTEAHARHLTGEEAAAHADWPRMTPEALNKIVAMATTAAAAAAAVATDNDDAPWSSVTP